MNQTEPTRVILDTDIGDDIDDAYALGVCLRHPALDLVGVCTVRGDTELRAAQARYLLALEGRPEIPVAAGSRDALDEFAPMERNCQAAVIPAHEEERWRAGRQDGVRALAEWAEAYPGATLVPIGPLTNIARLIREFPEAFRQIARLVIMGGHLRSDLDHPEWNFRCDPRAAQTVLACGKPILLVGLDVTLQCRMSREDLDAIRAARTPLTAALAAMTRLWQDACDRESAVLPVLHDPLAALAVVDPEVLQTAPREVRVDKYGNCLVGTGKPNVDFAIAVDARRALERITQLLK